MLFNNKKRRKIVLSIICIGRILMYVYYTQYFTDADRRSDNGNLLLTAICWCIIYIRVGCIYDIVFFNLLLGAQRSRHRLTATHTHTHTHHWLSIIAAVALRAFNNAYCIIFYHYTMERKKTCPLSGWSYIFIMLLYTYV